MNRGLFNRITENYYVQNNCPPHSTNKKFVWKYEQNDSVEN